MKKFLSFGMAWKKDSRQSQSMKYYQSSTKREFHLDNICLL